MMPNPVEELSERIAELKAELAAALNAGERREQWRCLDAIRTAEVELQRWLRERNAERV
jgi:hypothetical protein